MHTSKLIPENDDIWRWGLCELIGSSGCCPPEGDLCSSKKAALPLHQGGHSQKAAVCTQGRGSLPGTRLASTWTLNSPAYRTVRNKFLLLQSPSLFVCSCYSSLHEDMIFALFLMNLNKPQRFGTKKNVSTGEEATTRISR